MTIKELMVSIIEQLNMWLTGALKRILHGLVEKVEEHERKLLEELLEESDKEEEGDEETLSLCDVLEHSSITEESKEHEPIIESSILEKLDIEKSEVVSQEEAELTSNELTEILIDELIGMSSAEPTETASAESTEIVSDELVEATSTEPTETASAESTEIVSDELIETTSVEPTDMASDEPTDIASDELTDIASDELYKVAEMVCDERSQGTYEKIYDIEDTEEVEKDDAEIPVKQIEVIAPKSGSVRYTLMTKDDVRIGQSVCWVEGSLIKAPESGELVKQVDEGAFVEAEAIIGYIKHQIN